MNQPVADLARSSADQAAIAEALAALGEWGAPATLLVLRESAALRTIDGFLVTDGVRARITFKAGLSLDARTHGEAALLRSMHAQPGAGLFFWNQADA